MSEDRGPNDPTTRRVPLALQAQLRARRAELDSGAVRVGWKVGLNIAEVEEVMGPEPVFGYLRLRRRASNPVAHSTGVACGRSGQSQR